MISEALESAGAANALPWSPPKGSALEAHHVRRLRDGCPGDRPQLDRERELLAEPAHALEPDTVPNARPPDPNVTSWVRSPEGEGAP